MLHLIEIFDIVAIDKPLAKKALLQNRENEFLDFEDLLQKECAVAVDCDLVITNDKKFPKSEVKKLSLKEALEIV